MANFSGSSGEEVSDASDHVETTYDPRRGQLSALYERYFEPLVRGLRQKYGSGPPDPADVAQQTFERLQRRGELNDIKNLQSFAWITANNIVHSELRALRVRERHAKREETSFWDHQCDEIDPARVISAREELEIVAAAISALPERRREIFMACRFEGLTPEQAGKRAGVSRSSAVRHIAVATATLIEALANHQSNDATKAGDEK
ncbi:MAG: sigma-70 family RNA polymerase sigma factor [Pseudomonadota bacterium]